MENPKNAGKLVTVLDCLDQGMIDYEIQTHSPLSTASITFNLDDFCCDYLFTIGSIYLHGPHCTFQIKKCSNLTWSMISEIIHLIVFSYHMLT